MAGSMVAASRVGSRRILFEPEELCAERQGGLWHVRSEHSCNGNMHGCSCSWKPLSVCHVAGGYALMLNQLLLRVNGKADSNYTGPILPGGACSPCLSPLILYSLPHRAVNVLVKLFFPVLVETRLQRYSKERGQTACWGRASTGAPLQFVLAKLDFAWSWLPACSIHLESDSPCMCITAPHPALLSHLPWLRASDKGKVAQHQ